MLEVNKLTSKIIVVVNDVAKDVLVDYQREKGFKNRDSAAEALLLEFPKLRARVEELEQLKGGE